MANPHYKILDISGELFNTIMYKSLISGEIKDLLCWGGLLYNKRSDSNRLTMSLRDRLQSSYYLLDDKHE